MICSAPLIRLPCKVFSDSELYYFVEEELHKIKKKVSVFVLFSSWLYEIGCVGAVDPFAFVSEHSDFGKPLKLFYKDGAFFFNDPALRDFLIATGFFALEDFQDVPCGRCDICKNAKARQWDLRCQIEASFWPRSYFLTLTYADENLVFDDRLDFNFCKHRLANLNKKDLQDFNKRLRDHADRHLGSDELRFFACGEYGDLTKRPHFHEVVFNLPLNDLVYYSKSKSGKPVYMSAFLAKIWNKGFVFVEEYDAGCAGYVAGYVAKKHYKLDRARYELACEEKQLEPLAEPFLVMSRNPGIGCRYDLDQIQEEKGFQIVSRGRSYSVPRYFSEKISKTDLMKYIKLKNNNQNKSKRSVFSLLSDAEQSYRRESDAVHYAATHRKPRDPG